MHIDAQAGTETPHVTYGSAAKQTGVQVLSKISRSQSRSKGTVLACLISVRDDDLSLLPFVHFWWEMQTVCLKMQRPLSFASRIWTALFFSGAGTIVKVEIGRKDSGNGLSFLVFFLCCLFVWGGVLEGGGCRPPHFFM